VTRWNSLLSLKTASLRASFPMTGSGPALPPRDARDVITVNVHRAASRLLHTCALRHAMYHMCTERVPCA
jgi:hypothetical protein